MQEQFLGAIAFAGDLSMGQPPQHSPLTAILAARIAERAGAPIWTRSASAQLAMIRWAGCTANAREFAELLGDDIRGRSELIADRNPFVSKEPPTVSIHSLVQPLAEMHCDAAIEISKRASFDERLANSIVDLFENWDGSGFPGIKRGDAIHMCAQFVSAASDLEVFSRNYGATRASVLIQSRGGRIYDPHIATIVGKEGAHWLAEASKVSIVDYALKCCAIGASAPTFGIDHMCELLSDYADLKQPERVGLGRLAGRYAQAIAHGLGQEHNVCERVRRAASLSQLGFVAVPSAEITTAAQTQSEARRLAPHWTERILSRSPGLADEARIASLAYERLDGSGGHRGLTASSISTEARIVQLAVALGETAAPYSPQADCATRRKALQAFLVGEVGTNRFDDAIIATAQDVITGNVRRVSTVLESSSLPNLTDREKEVAAFLAKGLTNKQIAGLLDLSPKTVGTHLENVYRKLGVRTRAGATMKILEAGLLAS
ncbi:MAG: HD domain-containing phosphohydrolase [Pseudomonadota bacterium]